MCGRQVRDALCLLWYARSICRALAVVTTGLLVDREGAPRGTTPPLPTSYGRLPPSSHSSQSDAKVACLPAAGLRHILLFPQIHFILTSVVGCTRVTIEAPQKYV